MGIFQVADRLGKDMTEIERMPMSELMHWLAYLKIIHDATR